MLTLGRALVRLFLARQAARPRSLEYRQGGRTYRLDDRRVSHLGTRFGKVEFARPVGRQVGIGAQQRICSWTASCLCARVSPWAS